MQVNAGPVSQDGSGQSQPLGSMMGRPYDSKNMAIDSQLLQSAHHDDQAQALAAAAQQQTDRSAEYAIQQLQGYPGLKDETHHLPTNSQHQHAHHNPHSHHSVSHQGHPVVHPSQMTHSSQMGNQMSNQMSNQMAGQLGGQMAGQLGAQMAHPSQIGAQLGHQGHPGSLGHGVSHDPSAQGVVGQNGGVSSGLSAGNSQYSSSPSISKPVVGSEEYYRIKKYNHKEVERRRRETINKGIDELGKVVPECDKHKGQILAHAVEYIKMLKDKEETLMKQLTLEKLISEQSINELTSENKSLKNELNQAWKELEHYKRQSEGQPE